MPSTLTIWLRTALSLAGGAAAGVLENVLIEAHMNIGRVDWHQAALTAAGTAVVAVIMHWIKPPDTPITSGMPAPQPPPTR